MKFVKYHEKTLFYKGMYLKIAFRFIFNIKLFGMYIVHCTLYKNILEKTENLIVFYWQFSLPLVVGIILLSCWTGLRINEPGEEGEQEREGGEQQHHQGHQGTVGCGQSSARPLHFINHINQSHNVTYSWPNRNI